MNIKQETAADFSAIYDLVKIAFETAERSDGNEQEFVNYIRSGPNYIPELSLVAKDNGKLVGHIMLSTIYVDTPAGKWKALTLAPVSVALAYRKQGIGSQLIRTAMDKAKDFGYTAVFLAGNPAYYKRFGFVPTRRHGINCNLPVPEELLDCIMTAELTPDALKNVSGTLLFDLPQPPQA